ncbi:MAG: hypothetical protein Kow00107_07800 [Planctomycetota bacterium]
MPEISSNSKNSTIKWIHTKLKESFGDSIELPQRGVLDELVFNLLLQGSSKDRAEEALKALKEEYFDWNEVRVTIPSSIEVVIKGVGLESVKSMRLVKILQGIFEDRSEVDLEFLAEMNAPAIKNYLGTMEGIGESTVETVLTFALGKHFYPLNKPALRFAQRFGIISSSKEGGTAKDFKAAVEAEVEEGRMAEFVLLVDYLAENICRSDKPLCRECPLNRKCAFAKKSAKSKSAKSPENPQE